jgi:hypothetical protein
MISPRLSEKTDRRNLRERRMTIDELLRQKDVRTVHQYLTWITDRDIVVRDAAVHGTFAHHESDRHTHICYVNNDSPDAICNGVHELTHGVLECEGYAKIEWPSRFNPLADVASNLLNTVQHVEIYRRMSQLGVDTRAYYEAKCQELMTKLDRELRSGNPYAPSRRLQDLLIFSDAFHFGEAGKAVIERWRRQFKETFALSEPVMEEISILARSAQGSFRAAGSVRAALQWYANLYRLQDLVDFLRSLQFVRWQTDDEKQRAARVWAARRRWHWLPTLIPFPHGWKEV